MRKVFLILSAFTVIVSLFSCRVSRMNISTGGTPASAYDYIERWKDVAINEMRRTGVPASITLAQGMIESGYGRSRLAIEANNHFGIKCHNGWTGPT
ncbi:MAG TPA: glucosaminidase domain-containing protein, partial [Bacteroidales bacterium]|nr:glucosaminidase domain-containing protein [Bacteroidales bacterium]